LAGWFRAGWLVGELDWLVVWLDWLVVELEVIFCFLAG